ncbi:hypothetical protein CAPTEDRAFT_192766 [Capitella teleta]|uniref:Uncharacterized protein n=1 Tax=Capitella teleta TaxID=283909 RepID=R7TQ34_CAPTE|nr:hypothetical protein CAPTEDRAFT_192766 [Capitella teleta]|eukprot:ELT93621.1 hypothetical protein CAPTEDRAFT_192766 [Capitella teleta]
MLCSEDSPQLPSTRAGIYKAVHEFFIEKASQKTGHDKDYIERTIIVPLAKLSFGNYNKKKHLTEEDFKDLCCSPEDACQVGFLSEVVTVGSLLNDIRCYRFGHRTLQEYLVAIHLGKITADERLAWLQSKNVYQIDAIVVFLFGQLNNEDLVSTASAIMREMRFQPLNFSKLFYYSCLKSHLVLHCLNELVGRNISDKLKSVLADNCPPHIHLSRDCSISCIQGVSMILSLIKEKNTVNLTFDLDITKNFVPLMEQLKTSKCISNVQLNYPKDGMKFNEYLDALQAGQALSWVRTICIGHPDISKGEPKLNIGRHMFSMKLQGCESMGFSLRFLEAVMDQECSYARGLKGLHLADCHLNQECFDMLQQIMKSFSRHIKYLNISNVNASTFRVADLLSNIAGLSNLCSLNISLSSFERQDRNNFERILQKNSLTKLRLTKCNFSGELPEALRNCFPKMSNLRNISLFSNEVQDSPAFRQMISEARHLHCLQSINIVRTSLSDETLEALTSVLSELKDIMWVTLDRIGSNHHPSKFQNLFRAIAGCHRITSITLTGMHIGDALMPSLCKMVESLKDLQDLTLWQNAMSANALEDLSKALEHRPNKLNILDIADNEGSRSERVVELLQRNCRSVIHD